MSCPRCRAACEGRKRCCQECGLRIRLECPNCGDMLALNQEWCTGCGLKPWISLSPVHETRSVVGRPLNLRERIAEDVAERILAERGCLMGQRIAVSVLLADTAGSVSVPEAQDFSGAPSIEAQLCEMVIQKVCHYGGIVNEVVDGLIMALFGFPIPLEDAPQRAVGAAAAIHRELVGANGLRRGHGEPHAIRLKVGINTGPVVVASVGSDLSVHFRAVENTVRGACQMVCLAQPGTTCVSEDTFRLTEGLFRFEALGEEATEGVPGKIKAYHVLGRSSARTRFDVNAEGGLTRFVGRDREVEVLLNAYEKARAGRAQICSIVGEAGVGKSRLLYEFRKAVTTQDVAFLEGKCLSYGREAAYLPIIDILKSSYEIRDRDSDFEIRLKLKRGLRFLGIDEADVLPYLLELLSVKESGLDEVALSAEATRKGIIRALKQMIFKAAQFRPVIIALEDLHWMDASSGEVASHLVEYLPDARVLWLFTYRPEVVHTLNPEVFSVQINLTPLPASESLAMMAHLLGTYDIASNLKELILDKTGGVPLHIEEFVRSLIDLNVIEKHGNRYTLGETGTGATIDSTIQDVIMARLKALPAGAREVLQFASAIEREFSHRLVARAIGLPEHELLSRLSILRYSDLLYERGIYPDSTYVFRHVLIRDLCYQSLSESTRIECHRRIAEVICEHFPDVANETPEIPGYHFSEAGELEPAISFWQKAGEIAVRRSATREAVGHLTKALGMLKTLPEKLEHRRTELEIQRALGRLWSQTKNGPEALRMLSEVYPEFTEGFEAAESHQAKALLNNEV